MAVAYRMISGSIQRQLTHSMLTTLDNLAGLGIVYTDMGNTLIGLSVRMHIIRVVARSVLAAIYLPIDDISVP